LTLVTISRCLPLRAPIGETNVTGQITHFEIHGREARSCRANQRHVKSDFCDKTDDR
jgi:hypothetical protein